MRADVVSGQVAADLLELEPARRGPSPPVSPRARCPPAGAAGSRSPPPGPPAPRDARDRRGCADHRSWLAAVVRGLPMRDDSQQRRPKAIPISAPRDIPRRGFSVGYCPPPTLLNCCSMLLLDLVDREARLALGRWELFSRCRGTARHRLGRDHQVALVEQPVGLRVRGHFGPLVRVGAPVEHLRDSQPGEGLCPDPHRSGPALFREDDLPVLITQANEARRRR